MADVLKNKERQSVEIGRFAPDLLWEIAIAGMIKAADLMVVILQATQQLDHAPNRRGANSEVDILLVVIGPTSMLPENIEEFQTINLKDANEPQQVAPYVAIQILEKLKTLPPKTK